LGNIIIIIIIIKPRLTRHMSVTKENESQARKRIADSDSRKHGLQFKVARARDK